MEWSNDVLLAMLALVLGALVMSVALAVQKWFIAVAIARAEQAGDEARLEELTTHVPGQSAWANRIAGLFRPAPGSKEYQELAELLQFAGRRGRTAMNKYLVKRAVILGVAFICVFFTVLLFGKVAFFFGSVVLGGAFLGPKMVLRSEATGRQERIELSMPAALDLLEACIDAGLGLEQALTRVAAGLGVSAPDIADELAILVGELRAGLPVGDAFRKLSDRVDVDEVKTLCAVLIQSASLGAPLSKTLKQYSDTARKRRGLSLEERAGKITAAMTVPLTVCLLPSALLVVMGPAIIEILESIRG